MNILKLIFIAPLAGLLAMPVYAHHYDDDGYSRFDKRVERQKSRIREGVKSGELTRKEASKLRNQQKKITKLERKFTKDGHLSRQERKKLEKKQDKASKKIYRLKHNDRYKGRHGKAHKHHHGHHYGWHRKPSVIYSKKYWHKRPYYSFHDHGHRYFDDNGWALILRLSDSF